MGNFFQTDSGGGVQGPNSTTDNTIPRYSGTDGQVIKDSNVTLSDTNQFSTKNTNGDITFSPDGTGSVGFLKNRRDGSSNDTATGSNATLTAPTTPTVRLTDGSLVSVQNIPADSGGQVLTLINRTGNSITIINDSGGTASQRILTGTGADLTLENNAAIQLKYDGVSTSRWQVIGGSGGGGSGDVVGPASSVDNTIVRFNLTTGKLIQGSGVVIDDSDNVIIPNEKELRLSEATAGGTNYTGFKAPSALASNLMLTLPDAAGTAMQELVNNGSNTLQWLSRFQFQAGTDVTGLSNNTITDITGASLTIAAGTYLILYVGLLEITRSADPTSVGGDLIVTNAANTNLGPTARTNGLAKLSSTVYRGWYGGLFQYTSAGETIKMRGSIDASGGTITDRAIRNTAFTAIRIS